MSAAVAAIVAARAAQEGQTKLSLGDLAKFEEDERREVEEKGVWLASRPHANRHTVGSWKCKFITFADSLHTRVTSTESFELFFQACIGVMCVMIGLETYDAYEGNPIIEMLMGVLVLLFWMEVLLKFLAESIAPWRYFMGPDGRWNTVDLITVVLCLPGLPVGESGRLLRLVRLVRLGKVVANIGSFRVFVCGIQDAAGDIVNISALIVFVLYMYSVAGMVLLGENDPWNFGSLHRSFLTLFSMATMDGWTGVLYKNAYGCEVYHQGPEADDLDPVTFACPASKAQPVVTAIFCLTFVTVTGLVMLSMFIGVISIAMSETIIKVRQEKKHALQRKVLKRKAEKLKEAAETAGGGQVKAKTVSMASIEKHNLQEKLIAQTRLLFMGVEYEPVILEPKTPTGRMLKKVSKVCKRIVASKYFVAIIFTLIGTGGILVALKMYFTQLTDVTNAVGSLMTIVFTLEMLLKIAACGDRPWAYLYKEGEVQSWNLLDAFVVICNYTSIEQDLLMVLRMLVVFKLMKMHPYLRVSVASFLSAVAETGIIGSLMGIVFFFFAIIGVVLFKRNDPGHFQNLHIAMLTLFRVATLDDWVDVMNINLYGCELFSDDTIPSAFRACDLKASHDVRRTGIVAVIYFLSFIVIGTFVMLNLFIGVVVIEMEATMSQLEREMDVAERAKALGKKNNYSKAELKDLREMFHNMDADSSGDVNLEELELTISVAGVDISKEAVETMLEDIDEDGTGEIDFAEFVQFAVDVRKRLAKAKKTSPVGSKLGGAFNFKNIVKKKLLEKAGSLKEERREELREKVARLESFIQRRGLETELEEEEGIKLQGGDKGDEGGSSGGKADKASASVSFGGASAGEGGAAGGFTTPDLATPVQLSDMRISPPPPSSANQTGWERDLKSRGTLVLNELDESHPQLEALDQLQDTSDVRIMV
jgi:voltage-gated sodium channel